MHAKIFFCLFNPEVKIQKLTFHIYIQLMSLGKILIQTSFIHFIYSSLFTYVYIFVCMCISYVIYLFAVFLVDAYHCCITSVTAAKPWHSRVLWKSFLQFPPLPPNFKQKCRARYLLNSEVSVFKLRFHVENLPVSSFPQDRLVT